jgi:hypothetical protein
LKDAESSRAANYFAFCWNFFILGTVFFSLSQAWQGFQCSHVTADITLSPTLAASHGRVRMTLEISEGNLCEVAICSNTIQYL